jgi:hypothetical protein
MDFILFNIIFNNIFINSSLLIIKIFISFLIIKILKVNIRIIYLYKLKRVFIFNFFYIFKF